MPTLRPQRKYPHQDGEDEGTMMLSRLLSVYSGYEVSMFLSIRPGLMLILAATSKSWSMAMGCTA